MDAIAKTLLCIGLMLIGAAAWIVAERLRVVEPYCLVTSEIYDAVGRKP